MWRWFEHFVILPLRWYRQHARNWREGHQRCKCCGVADGMNFHVPDAIWAAVVPDKYRTRVLCLRCFDRFAKEKGVDYATSLEEVNFVGAMACLSWEKPTATGAGSD